jgi:hypothetical protein
MLPVEKPEGNERQGKQREPFQSRHALAVVGGRKGKPSAVKPHPFHEAGLALEG